MMPTNDDHHTPVILAVFVLVHTAYMEARESELINSGNKTIFIYPRERFETDRCAFWYQSFALNLHLPPLLHNSPHSTSPYVLAEHTPPALCRAVKAVDTTCFALLRTLGHLHCRAAMVARVFALTERPRAHAAETSRIVIAEWIAMAASTVHVLIVGLAFAGAAASAFRLGGAGVGCGVVGVGVRVRAGGAGFVETELLFLVVCFVADSCAPGLVGVEPAACSTAARLSAVAWLFVGPGGGAIVPVLELADLRVDEAFDAGGRGAGVVGGGA